MRVRGLLSFVLGVAIGLALNQLIPRSPLVLPISGIVFVVLVVLLLVLRARRRSSSGSS